MTGTLEFTLPDEQHEFDVASAAPRLLSALWDVAQELRRRRKYTPLSEAEGRQVDEIETFLYQTCDIYGVNLERLCE